jgi:tripartite-type tricarboxylate transporter receptor subunit TctC
MVGVSRRVLGAAAALAAIFAAPVAAEDFYKDKDVRFIISAGVGGGYSAYGRALTRHIGKHIPGNPNFIVQNMPGGGGIKASNYLYAVAPKDGSVFGLVHTAVLFAPLYGMKAAKFDGTKFNIIGAMDSADGLCVAWHDSGVKTWQDLFSGKYAVGGTGAGSQMETMPRLLNNLFGTRIKIISGYKGGNDVYLAMERGEVHGRCGGITTSIKSTRPDWFPQKKVVVPIQISLERSKDFPDVPAVAEFAKDQRTKDILEFALAYQSMDRPIIAPPGLPAERVALLRKAFDATMKDPAFIKDATKMKLSLDARGGEAVTKIIARTYAKPKAIVKETAALMKPKKK